MPLNSPWTLDPLPSETSCGTIDCPERSETGNDVSTERLAGYNPQHPPEQDGDNDPGSNWIGASFNLTSSILGAGCIGLGGAIADSGGLISFLAILVFAILSKYSFDLVVDLAVETQNPGLSNYESLGYATYQNTGRLMVILSKGLYCIGCLVADIVIVRDNASGVLSYFFYGGSTNTGGGDMMQRMLENRDLVTMFFSLTVMLPLCMLRDLTPLERFSAFKVSVLLMIVGIVIYLFFAVSSRAPAQETDSDGFIDHWITIHDGVFKSLGTFVFTFASNHTIHLVFQSMKPSQRKHFGRTTSLGTALSTGIAMSMGFFVYITFWDTATSNIFSLYPPSGWAELCRGLLCISMLLTYPFPFLATRELLVLSFVSSHQEKNLEEGDVMPSEESRPLFKHPPPREWRPSRILLPGSDRQLRPKFHIGLTVALWLFTVVLALNASSLGSVLNLTGCATGTAISYIIPAVFSYKCRGPTILGALLFTVGGLVGVIGTYYSFLAL
jgi:sodium-coupled neutral amino acid transporter 11